MLNWKLIFRLSFFGLAMAFLTVSIIPGNIEMLVWLPVFIVIAYIIAKGAPGKFFLHGFMVSMVNCIWVVAAHLLFYDSYIAHHAQEAEMLTKMHAEEHPQMTMLVMAP